MPSRDLERLMWSEACEMLDRAERLHRQFFRPGRGTRVPVWEPPVDLFETAEGLSMIVAMPGAAADSIKVNLEGASLVIQGHRPLPAEAHGGALHRLEIPHGLFERRLPLPAGSYRLDEKSWQDGCLHLRLRVLERGAP